MNDKTIIFSQIKTALSDLNEEDKVPRPVIDFKRVIADPRLVEEDEWIAFKSNFESVRGKVCNTIEDLGEFLVQHGTLEGYCDPELREAVGDPLSKFVTVAYQFNRSTLENYAFGITRGSSVVAETGSILLKDSDTVNRLAALAPWIHVAVLPREKIYRTMHQAITDFDDDPNIIWVTGPSKTADVEGIMVEGVHGPGEQVCYILD